MSGMELEAGLKKLEEDKKKLDEDIKKLEEDKKTLKEDKKVFEEEMKKLVDFLKKLEAFQKELKDGLQQSLESREDLKYVQKQLECTQKELRDIVDELKRSQLIREDGVMTTIKETLEKIVNAEEKYDDVSMTRYLRFESFEFVDGNKYETLMVRDCYDKIMKEVKVWSENDDFPHSKKIVGDLPNLVTILGSPGVGRSLMLLYLVHVFRNLGWTVRYRNNNFPDCTFVVSSHGIRVIDSFGRRLHGPDFDGRKEKVVCLYDSVRGVCDSSLVILAASPDQDELFNEFKKCGCHKFAYMPTWSKSEFSQFSSVCLGRPLEKDMEERIKYFGGLPRRILFKRNQRGESLENELKRLVFSVSKPRKLMYIKGKPSRNLLSAFYDLVHIVPDETFRRFSYRYASFFVIEKLYLECQMFSPFIDLRDAVAFARDVGESFLAGNMFEVFCFEMLENGGKFRRKNLKTGVLSEITLEEGQLGLVREDASPFGSEDGLIFDSKRQKEPVVGFVTNCHLMHATMNRRRDFIVNSVNVDWLSNLLEEGGGEYDICYVVPDEMLDEYPIQTIRPSYRSDSCKRKREGVSNDDITGTDDNIKKVHKTMKGMNQYAIGIKGLRAPPFH